MKEKWLPVPGFVGLYEISNLGQVRSRKRKTTKPSYRSTRTVSGGILKQYGKIYNRVSLYRDGVKTQLSVAHLVAHVFIPNPNNHYDVIFKNGNKKDCRVSNLKWASRREVMTQQGK